MKPLLGWIFLVLIGLILAYATSFIWWAPMAVIAWVVVAWAIPKNKDGTLVPILMWTGLIVVLVAVGTLLRGLL